MMVAVVPVVSAAAATVTGAGTGYHPGEYNQDQGEFREQLHIESPRNERFRARGPF